MTKEKDLYLYDVFENEELLNNELTEFFFEELAKDLNRADEKIREGKENERNII